jgi:hypothetical protein
VEDPATFGVFLSSFSVAHETPKTTTLRTLAKEIHEKTRLVKKHKLYLRTFLEVLFGLLLLRFANPEKKKSFYAKKHPIWAGLTNIHLKNHWPEAGKDIPVDYLRAVSTSAAYPLVFSITTVYDVLNVGVSFNEGIFSRDQVREIAERFVAQIERIGGEAV